VALAVILVAAMAQRIAGLGFAMVIAPFMVLMLGPHSGILLVNLCGAISAGVMFLRVYRDTNWRMYWSLTLPALLASVPFSILALALPAAPLQVAVGVLLLAALITSLALHRGAVTIDGPGVRAATGLSSGITNALAGVGGPTVSVYAIVSRWDQRSFAATIQPYFVTIGLASMTTKAITDPGEWPELAGWMWAAIVVVIVGGMAIGEVIGRHVPDKLARRAVIVIAFVGAAATLIKGLLELAG
jgi:uncharacterized membrane protein YfcA